MSSPRLSAADGCRTPPRPSTSEQDSASPVPTVASRTFSSRLSTSTLASSPAPTDSFEIFSSSKPSLSRVREAFLASRHDEDQERLSAPFFSGAGLKGDASGFYDFDDSPSQSFHEIYPTAKKARSSDTSALSGVPEISKRFNSLPRKWKTKTGAGPKLSIDVATSDPLRFRSGSAGSALVSPTSGPSNQRQSAGSSPTRTMFEENIKDVTLTPVDIERANAHQDEERAHTRTPLLPPTLKAVTSDTPSNVQSPLQSPTIADSGFFIEAATPAGTPRVSCLPSPPLSNKPSIASIRQRSRAGTMVGSGLLPPAEIPPMIIDAEDEDSWSAKLGHADFTILPEPYLPLSLDLEACKRFREDSQQAKINYAKHLARTAENFGTTSRVYKLTEEKWAEIEAQWKAYNVPVLEAIQQLAEEQDLVLVTRGRLDTETIRFPQIPATDIVAGKFPILGHEDFIGPMAVGPALTRFISQEEGIRPSKKRNFFKFISDLLVRGTVRV